MATDIKTIRINVEAEGAVKDAQKLFERYEKVGAEIKLLKQNLKEIGTLSDEEVGRMTKRLDELTGLYKELGAVVKNAVTEQKNIDDILSDLTGAKYNELTRARNMLLKAVKASRSDAADYQEILDKLREINHEIDKRSKSYKELTEDEKEMRKIMREAVVNDADRFSIKELEEALKLTRELRDTETKVGSIDYEKYKEEEEMLQSILDRTKELSKAEQQRIAAKREQVAEHPEYYSIDEIKEAIKQTEKLRNSEIVNSSEFKEYDKQLNNLKETLKEAEKPVEELAMSADELEKVLRNLPTTPFDDLKKASEALSKELKTLAPNTEEFIAKSAELREVNGQMDNLNDKWKDHDGAILSTIKRLTAYVAVYGSFNFILGKLKGWTSDMLKLSDSMADVQKTTGIAGKQLVQLSRDIDHIDTRSTQEQMHNLAATAGQIGLKSREDILGFVKASDQLTVALNELGDEGVQSLAKLATLTGEVQRMGIEKSMLAIGSSINELSANSAASAGPISDFMRRVGGLANMANLSSADLAALGATVDALGQPTEVAATAMNKFITTLVTKTEDVAYALNLDLDMINSLIESGDTMKAITKVLESVRAKGDEGALAGIFKELGSEGARMQQVMMALAENTNFLRQQITISREAFEEATSATNEYNVKNETAAAVVERIGNTIREFFVRADYTQGLTNLLNKVHDFIKLMISASDEAVFFRAVLGSILVMKFTWNPAKQFALWALELRRTTAAAVGLRKAWVALKAVFTGTNLLALALTAIAGSVALIVNAFKGWGKEAKRLAETLDDLRQQEEGEKKHLEELYTAMTNANISTEKRSELIQAFNDKYSSYLGYLLDESADVDELTRAYELLNAQLELRYAKMLSTEYMKGPLEEYGREVREINTKLLSDLEDFGTKSGVHPKVLLESISIAAKKFAEEGARLSSATGNSGQEFITLMRTVKELSVTDNALLEKLLRTNMGNIQNLIQAERDLVIARYRAEEEEGILVKTAQDRVDRARKATMDGLKEEVQAYANNTDSIKEMKEEEVEAIIDKGNTVLNYLKEMGDKEAETFAVQLDKIREVYAGDAWGKALNIKKLKEAYGNLQNIKTASVDNLVETYKTLEDAGKRYTNVTEFNSLFGMDAKTIDEMHAFFKNYARQVKDRLKELGYTTAGNFDWASEAGKKRKNEIKQQYEAALAALEAYYKEEETVIRDRGMRGNITETEMEQRLLENEEQFLKDRQELRKRMLGEQNVFDPTKYIGSITHTDYFKDKDLDLLSKQMKDWGAAMTDGIRLGLAEDMNAIEEQAWKMKQKILEIVNDREWHAKVDREMLASFEGIGAFWGKSIERNEANAKNIINEMKRVSQYIYTEDQETFKKRLEQNMYFGEMFKELTEDQQKAFLILLGDYHDKVIDADKKFADERKRIYKQALKDSGVTEAYEEANEKLNAANATLDWFDNNGAIARQKEYFNAKQMLIAAEIDLEVQAHQARLDLMNKMGATQQMRMEEERAYAEKMQKLSENLIENYKLRYEKMADVASTYGSILGDGLTRMALDEENAGQEMIKSLLRTTVEMASQFAQRLIMQNTFGAAMQSIKAQQTAQETAAAYAAAMTQIGIEASKMAAIEAIAAGSITAQSMSLPDSVMTYGAAGAGRAALLIGLVAAATAGALALIDSLFPGSAAEAESASSTKRKLTTGMLTYAEGKYPVLGNDGVVYDAKYAGANMQTGIYRGPHYGIFSEKKPEMVIDGDTTQRLVMNYPALYESILTLSRHGHLGMRTYADGNVADFATASAAQQAQMEAIQQALIANAAAVAALNKRLEHPIGATINRYGRGGSMETERKAQKWEKKNRV